MAKLDMAKIREQLAAAKRTVKKTSTQSNSKAKELLWKPDEGENLIRIVPSQHQEGSPFEKITFHYKFTKNFNGEEKATTYISPTNFGKPDPIVELSDRLKESGDRKLWGRGKFLEPKARTYVPVIIRGKESEGVKYWGFGVQIFEQLVGAMDELETAGESITDLANGYDIRVDFIPAEKSNKADPKTGKKFPDTKITVKRKSSPVVPQDFPNVKEVLKKITSEQPKLIDAWDCPSYDDLAKSLEVFLKRNEAGRDAAAGNVPVVATEETVEIPTQEQVAQTAEVSPSAAQAAVNLTKSESTEDMKDVYDELFGLKS